MSAQKNRLFSLFGLLVGMFFLTAVLGHSAQSTPGYASGPLQFVDGSGLPIAGETLRVLCYQTPSGPPAADLQILTAVDGTAVLPPACAYLAAYRLHHTQPSGKPGRGPAYEIYATSYPPTSTAPLPAAGIITIDEENSLVLFHLVVSLGWEPAPGSPYLAELRAGLASASAYLYDMSEGKAAFGPLAILTNGRLWNGADIRIQPANDARPSAYIGGMVAATTPYAGPVAATNYVPANIFLGRYWDGNDAHTGSWAASPGYTTLIHEWSHYAFFLYDEYIQPSGLSTYCVCDTLPGGCGFGALDASLMAYHYSTSELWHDSVHAIPAACTSSQHYYMHGLTDWKVMANWHLIQNVVPMPPMGEPLSFPTTLTPGPALTLAGDLLGRVPGYRAFLPLLASPGVPPSPAYDADVEVYVNDPAVVTATMPTEVYLLEAADSETPERVVHQGTLLGPPDPVQLYRGLAGLVGVQPNDRLRIYLDRYATDRSPAGRYLYPHPDGGADDPPLDGGTVELLPSNWPVSLDLAQELSDGRFTKLTVDLRSPGVPLANVMARLCVPDTAVGCAAYWTLPMAPADGTGEHWQADFTPAPGAAELPNYGVILISEPDMGQAVSWFQVAGGVGPGHIHGDAPLRDGLLMVDTITPIPMPDDCNQVLVSPAKNEAALMASLGTDAQGVTIGGLIGSPLDVNILLPTGGQCQPLADNQPLPVDVTLTFFYNQALINQLQLLESDLRLLRFDPDNNSWSEVFANDQNTDLNWMSTIPVDEHGIYALGYVVFP